MSDADENWLYGTDARARALEILSGHQASGLAEDVAAFYGDTLRLTEVPGRGKSSFSVKNRRGPFRFDSASIWLDSGTNRVREALSHELLHLETYMLGYPSMDKISLTATASGHLSSEDTLTDVLHKFNNLIHHELMIERFLDLGFNRVNFVSRADSLPDYRKIATTQTYDEKEHFYWWCLEQFRHWITLRQSPAKGTERAFRQSKKWALVHDKKLRPALERMQEMIIGRAFDDMNEYSAAFNALLQLAHVPAQVAGWIRLGLGNDLPSVEGLNGYDGT